MHVHLEALQRRERLGIKRGLENIRALLAALGQPDRAYPVVLIGGTNGKGSVGAFLSHALRAGGYRVGWTTSPHLVSVTERIQVDGRAIPAEALEALLGRIFAAERAAGVEATYFEVMVAAALLAFAEAKVGLALVEVGLGGRWDSTNATEPILSVVTSIGLDHQVFLGDTREAIAREKLCIARPRRPLVLGPGLEAAWIRPLLETAPQIHSALPLAEGRIHLDWDHSLVDGRRVGLAGRFQLDNLATALRTLDVLADHGFPVSEHDRWRGISGTRWPGRLWQVPGLGDVWMDGAHNPDGARVLADHALACGLRPHLIFGAMKDKDLPGVAAELRRMAPRSITFVRGEGERYADAEHLQPAWGGEVRVLSIPEAAALLQVPQAEPRLVAGSLYLLGDLLKALGIQP